MTDTREDIMSRLVEIMKTVVPAERVFRNVTNVPEGRSPIIAVLEGDEEEPKDLAAIPGRRPGRPGPVIMEMRPQIYALEGQAPGDVGPALNALRAKIIRAVSTDTALLALAKDSAVNYRGMATGLASGRTMRAEGALVFSIQYVLYPERL